MFYDLHVHTSLSIGENTVEEAVEMARRLGLSGIGIVRYHPDVVALPEGEIDIVNAIMIKAETPGELEEAAKKFRRRAEVLMVHGGTYDINRAACENPLIDVLCHPDLGRRDSGLDHICAKAAKENEVAIEINFRQIAESWGKHRSYIIKNMSRNVMLCREYGADMVTCSGSISKWGMRSGRDMAAAANILGLELGAAIATASETPRRIVERNRSKLESGTPRGVERGA